MDASGEAEIVTFSKINGFFDVVIHCTKNGSSIRRKMSERAPPWGQQRSDVQVFFWEDNAQNIHADARERRSECDKGQGGDRRVTMEAPHHFHSQMSMSLPAANHLFIACTCFILCFPSLIFPVFFSLLSYMLPISHPTPPSPTPRGSVLRIIQILH